MKTPRNVRAESLVSGIIDAESKKLKTGLFKSAEAITHSLSFVIDGEAIHFPPDRWLLAILKRFLTRLLLQGELA